MSRSLMGSRCPDARALGVATLSGWRFVVNPDGFGSLADDGSKSIAGQVLIQSLPFWHVRGGIGIHHIACGPRGLGDRSLSRITPPSQY